MRDRGVATLARLGRLATEHAELVMAGRSHNVAAQATTLGKRFATVADELLVAFERLDDLIARYPLRGIKGPVGTAQDQLDLLGGDEAKLAELEQRVARHLGFDKVLTSVGQVYPRSLDYDVVTALVQLSSAPSNLATTIRLMAGNEIVTEGFKPGQVGSSAMPHKMNTRSCERVNGLAVDPARLRLDGRRARRRPVERGRRVVLGRAPGRAARRVLRRRRTVRDVPDGPRRVRRVPGRHPARARPLPAVPGDDQGADGRGAPGPSAARRRTTPSSSTPSRSRWRCARRAPPRTTCSPGSPPTSVSACPRPTSRASSPRRSTSPGAAVSQVHAVVAPHRAARRGQPAGGGLHARLDPLAADGSEVVPD